MKNILGQKLKDGSMNEIYKISNELTFDKIAFNYIFLN